MLKEDEQQKINELAESGQLEEAMIIMFPHVLYRARNMASGYSHLRDEAQSAATYALVTKSYKFPYRKNKDTKYVPYIYKGIKGAVLDSFSKSCVVSDPRAEIRGINEDDLSKTEDYCLDTDLRILLPAVTLRIVLHTLDGITVRAIAKIEKMSKSTVQRHLDRARVELKGYL